MRISDWSSDVCSSDLDGNAARVLLPRADVHADAAAAETAAADAAATGAHAHSAAAVAVRGPAEQHAIGTEPGRFLAQLGDHRIHLVLLAVGERAAAALKQRDLLVAARRRGKVDARSEEHTSELQSLMRISYAVFCLK